MTPECRTLFSIKLSEGEVYLIPEVCDQVVLQTLLRAGVKGPALARAIDVDRRTVNRYERGTTMPSLETVVRILNHLGYDLIIKRR